MLRCWFVKMLVLDRGFEASRMLALYFLEVRELAVDLKVCPPATAVLFMGLVESLPAVESIRE